MLKTPLKTSEEDTFTELTTVFMKRVQLAQDHSRALELELEGAILEKKVKIEELKEQMDKVIGQKTVNSR